MKKEVKYTMKQNKILFSVANCLGSCRELKKIRKIRAKASNKYDSSRSDISVSDYDYSLYSDSE